MKLYMCKGLPASGKDTWASEQVLASGGKTKRVNKDMLREMIDASKWSKDREKQIICLRDKMIEHWLQNNFNVICSDTNLAEKHEKSLRALAKTYKAEFIIVDHFLRVPITECIERDLKRGDKSVGKAVITDMYYKFIYEVPLPITDKDYIVSMRNNTPFNPCIICDLDGTLAIHQKRNPYNFKEIGTDIFNSVLWNILVDSRYPVVFLSGRPSGTKSGLMDVYDATANWIKKHTGLKNFLLLMRGAGDNRKDYIVKRELYNELIEKYELVPIIAFDDRDQVVDMWRELGITTAQMNYGGF